MLNFKNRFRVGIVTPNAADILELKNTDKVSFRISTPQRIAKSNLLIARRIVSSLNACRKFENPEKELRAILRTNP